MTTLDFFLATFVTSVMIHTTILPSSLQPSCANQHALSFASGAAVAATGLDRLFTGFGAPPAVHWALAGAAADYYCKQVFAPDANTAMCLASGYAGGFVATMLLGR